MTDEKNCITVERKIYKPSLNYLHSIYVLFIQVYSFMSTKFDFRLNSEKKGERENEFKKKMKKIMKLEGDGEGSSTEK